MSKKSFVLRIDEDTYKAIERWAADDFRSVNGQIEWLIDKALKESKRRAAPAIRKESPPGDDNA
jgi:hypothetical protein